MQTSERASRRVLVTRPLDQAVEWASQLQSRGIDAAALPLIGIEPVADAGPVHAAWAGLSHRHLLVFVSPNAVAHFFSQRPADAKWPDHLVAASPGPGTSAALRAAGIAAPAIVEPPVAEGRFDSEALWDVLKHVRDWRDAQALVLRGSVDDTAQGSGRDWLAQQLREAGAHIDLLAVYRRAAPRFDAAQHALWQGALAEPSRHVWLFSSSEAIDHGEALARADADRTPWHRSAAVATHPRIADRARRAGFAAVIETAPTLEAVAAAITGDSDARAQDRSINSDRP